MVLVCSVALFLNAVKWRLCDDSSLLLRRGWWCLVYQSRANLGGWCHSSQFQLFNYYVNGKDTFLLQRLKYKLKDYTDFEGFGRKFENQH